MLQEQLRSGFKRNPVGRANEANVGKCGIFPRQLPRHDAKRHYSAFHFSVLFFAQTNLTWSSYLDRVDLQIPSAT